MQTDKITIQDLYIFGKNDERSIFSLLDFTNTSRGKAWLEYIIRNPSSHLPYILKTQNILKGLIPILDKWTSRINNGTILVIETFCETDFAKIPTNCNFFQAYFYKFYHKFHFNLIKYSIKHFTSFIDSIHQILFELSKLDNEEINEIKNKIENILNNREVFKEIISRDKLVKISDRQYLKYGYYLQASIQDTLKLIDEFGRLEALFSLASACKKHQFTFPKIIDQEAPFFKAKALLNPLLESPKPADVEMIPGKNFLFLTGANMAGKSTFIRSVGISVYMAHLGMAVPAASLSLSVFDGIHSNIHVVDSITRGESYYYNEVKRIKFTLEKISDGKKWLILIDELFKGTNIQDAQDCSLAVIAGMSKLKNTCCVLSTHLYSISNGLFENSNIQFRYFESVVNNDEYSFTYKTKEGVSNDKIGYLILKHEGVESLLGQIEEAREY
ncbi:MAG: MutS family DNA mismatch repair protein [Ginsengibacter sp.]